MTTGISIVLPSYQEAENLKKILPEIDEQLKKLNIPFEILVIDTISPLDDTPDVCKKVSSSVYLPRTNGNHYGDAIRTGIRAAQYPYILMMDADGSHNPKDIAVLYATIEKDKADLVIGSRYIEGGNSHNGPILKLMSYMLNLIYRLIFKLPFHDISNSFRIYNAAKLKKLNLECQNFDIVEEILIQFIWNFPESLVKEQPVFFAKRAAGESKRSLFAFICSYFATITRLLKIKKRIKH